ncbi:MAG TPA: hypothetical protein VKT77_15180 [Chthonomonadaceae bacterium]|nr:hypothetical protein [Chthonomonadaceae bacterium]
MPEQSQTSIAKQVRDRRAYVIRHAIETALAFIGAIVFAAAALPLLVAGLIRMSTLGEYSVGIAAPDAIDHIPLIASFIGSLVLCGLGIWLCFARCRKANAMPYVPPVPRELAARASDETLLRAAGVPVATPDEMLRAAQPGLAAEDKALLRASPGAEQG